MEYTAFHASVKYEFDDPHFLWPEEGRDSPMPSFEDRVAPFKKAGSSVTFPDACHPPIYSKWKARLSFRVTS